MPFGSDYLAAFGIPAFPFEGVDPQGGLFGVNVTAPGQSVGAPMTAPATGVSTEPAGPVASPALKPSLPDVTPAPQAATHGSPLASPMATGFSAGGRMDTPPAAGVTSPFGRSPL